MNPDPYFESYNPTMYRDLTITDEGNGYFRIYRVKDQLGFAPSLKRAKHLCDEFLDTPGTERDGS